MSKSTKREIEELKEKNKILEEENSLLKAKLESKRKKLQRSCEDLEELAERKAQEILRSEERYKIVVNVSNGGIMNFSDSPMRSPKSPTSPKKFSH